MAYSLKAEEGDGMLKIWNASSRREYTFDRGESPIFSEDGEYLFFKIHPHEDSIKAMRRKDVKKGDLTKDSLGILKLNNQELVKIANVKKFTAPEKWNDWVVYHKEVEKIKKVKPLPDTTSTPGSLLKEKPNKPRPTSKSGKKKAKKEGKKTGTKLVLRHLPSGQEDTVVFVLNYEVAEEGPKVLLNSTGNDSTLLNGIYLFDCSNKKLNPMWRDKGEYSQLTLNRKGNQITFVANLDTSKAQIPPIDLMYWKTGLDSAKIIADENSGFLHSNWLISKNGKPSFSDDGFKLFFGVAPPPILQDTNLLDDEIVNVEVWSYTDGRLHTQQKRLLDREKKRSYKTVWNIPENKFTNIGSEELPETRIGDEGNAAHAIAYIDGELQLISWEGSSRKNVYLIDVKTGNKKEVVKGLNGNVGFSPNANYIMWYNRMDSVYAVYSIKNNSTKILTPKSLPPFYNELNDVPNHPWPYGVATWTKDDKAVLIYDRYDIWQFDPNGNTDPVRLTNGRENKTIYRYIKLDKEERFIENGQRLLLNIFDEKTMGSGYTYLNYNSGKPVELIKDNFYFSRRPIKAKNVDKIIFTKENFQTFPDLLYTNLNFQNPIKISDGNGVVA